MNISNKKCITLWGVLNSLFFESRKVYGEDSRKQ